MIHHAGTGGVAPSLNTFKILNLKRGRYYSALFAMVFHRNSNIFDYSATPPHLPNYSASLA
jgi:hypothetical protein